VGRIVDGRDGGDGGDSPLNGDGSSGNHSGNGGSLQNGSGSVSYQDIFDIDQLLGRVGGSGDSKQPCTGSVAIKEEAPVGWGTSNDAATVAATALNNLDNDIPEFDDSFFSELFPDLDVDSAVAF